MIKFEDLSEEVQKAIKSFCDRMNIEKLPENLDNLANKYDTQVYEEVVKVSTIGVIGGVTARQFISHTRNEIIKKMVDNSLKMAEEYGQNLMKVSHNKVVSPLCVKYQNRIYWTIEPFANYVELDTVMFWRGGNGDTGLFHPYCRHQMYAYFPGESDPPIEDNRTLAEIDEEYKLQQELNYIKRNKKQWYTRKEKARITNSPHKDYETKKWKEWTAREKQFIEKHGTMRD